MNDLDTNAMDTSSAMDLLGQVRGQLQQVLIGQETVIDQVLTALLAGGHVLIEGVPGLGKTLLVRALAQTFGGRFVRIQFTPDLMPTDITGHTLYNMNESKFEVRKGPVFTNLLLADEINRAPAKTQAALLEVMQEQQVTIEGKPFRVADPFMVLATQNPIEQEGTYPLPEAQLDRFMFKVFMDYPAEAEEVRLVRDVTGSAGQQQYLEQARQLLQPEQITRLREKARAVAIDQQVLEYLVRLVRATRDWRGVHRGAGPRGGIWLAHAARARALMDGRDFVIPDDIKAVARPVLRHRILLSADMEIEGVRPDQVLREILDETDAPRQ